MQNKKVWLILTAALVLIMALSLFACDSGNGEETEGSSEITSGSTLESTLDSDDSETESETVESESDTVESEETDAPECQHEKVTYKNNASGRCEKSCVDCGEVLETPRHDKGDPDPYDGCNIKCTRCDMLLAEGKHSRGAPDIWDGCKIKCTRCDVVIGDPEHGTPDEDEWKIDPQNPQYETAICPDCGLNTYREASTTPDGLVLFSPTVLSQQLINQNITCTVETDKTGLRYFHTVSNNLVENTKNEATITLNTGSETLFGIGKYVAMMVRKDGGAANIELWINKAGTGNSTRAKAVINSVVCDGKWRLMIFDFSNAEQVDPAKGIGWTRLDINPPRESGEALDIAFVGFFNTVEDVNKYYKTYVEAYVGAENCAHDPDNKWAAATEAGKVSMHCSVCNTELSVMDCLHNDPAKLTSLTAVADKGTVYFTADCGICGKTGIDVTTLTHEGNKLFTAAELMLIAEIQAAKNVENNGEYKRYSASLITDDADAKNMPYVRFTAKMIAECCLLLNDGTETLDGKYLNNYVAILYRKPSTTLSPVVQLLYTSKGSTTNEGHSSGTSFTVNNGGWQIAIIDLSANRAINIKDGLGWTRLDIIDPTSKKQMEIGDQIDIAYVGFFSSSEAAEQYYISYLKEYVGVEGCGHRFEGEWQATGNVNEMKNTCAICKNEIVAACDHVSDGNWIKTENAGEIKSVCTRCTGDFIKACWHEVNDDAWSPTENQFEFAGICNLCDQTVVMSCQHMDNEISIADEAGKYKLVCNFCGYERASIDTNAEGLILFGPEYLLEMANNQTSNINGKYSASILSDESNGNMPFIRLQLSANTPRETFFWINERGEATIENIGNYFVIAYRLSNGCASSIEVFISSDESITDQHGVKRTSIVDGEWHFEIFDFSKALGWSGDAAVQQLRIDVFNGANIAEGEYFDLAFAGFFTSAEKAESHYDMFVEKYGIGGSEFYAHFDGKYCLVDGAELSPNNANTVNRPMTADLSQKVLTSATSIQLGGWCVAPGGVQSINYRVIDEDRTVSELKKLTDGAEGSVDVKKATADYGFGDDRTLGGAFQSANTVDLTGYEGKTVTVQVVIVNGNGREAVTAILRNISVPAAISE